ncbi:MAG: uroporphyrinogen decarboxylase family protein [bacterium]|jgi:uroporphyrinogen decarboxylase|nr:uroporphyrinogen decarboxylase family protein [bacterium]
MNSRERVLATLHHQPTDRVPLNLWNFRADVQKAATARHGSLDAFNEKLGIDLFMAITPPPNRLNPDFLEERMTMEESEIRPEHILDPDDPAIYKDVEVLIQKHQGEKAIAAHVWGVVESVYAFIGIERTLVLMAAEPEKANALFARMAEFSRRVAANLSRMKIDILHLSGDVGANGSMLFSPAMWRNLVRPHDEAILAPGKAAGLPLSLHTCGYFMPIIPDLLAMGFQLIHPIQESAGMDQTEVKRLYGDRLTIHGGLDVRELPRLSGDEVETLVRHKMETLKPGGGFVFCTGHTLQPDTDLAVVERAYAAARRYGSYHD